jgi:hypothetical protein
VAATALALGATLVSRDGFQRGLLACQSPLTLQNLPVMKHGAGAREDRTGASTTKLYTARLCGSFMRFSYNLRVDGASSTIPVFHFKSRPRALEE